MKVAIFPHRYVSLCTVEELKAKVSSLCQNLEANNGGCQNDVEIMLNVEGYTSRHKRTIAVCYNGNTPVNCLSAGDKEEEVIIWEYNDDTCYPQEATNRLNTIPNDSTCANCFGLF